MRQILSEFHQNSKQQAILLYGPTASGKSALSLELASELNNAIIVNADSMQVYQEIPIITAQPQDITRHYLYGYISCAHSHFSVAEWLSSIAKILHDAIHKNKIPIIVGGTGMYINSLLNGLTQIPKTPNLITQRIQNEIDVYGIHEIHRRLMLVDEITATKICDPQRIARALGVFEHTGKPISYWQKFNERYVDETILMRVYVTLSREKLYERIDNRFVQMIDSGAIDEAIKLLNKHPNIQYPKAIGLQQIISYLNNEMNKNDMIKISQQLTRNYAKRQETWFKNQMSSPHIKYDAEQSKII